MRVNQSNNLPPDIGEIYSNAYDKEPGSISASFDAPYEHPPPELKGDPWATLLATELEADKIRCDAWKEEVQNLLIFAGLFSAVVTAFVIESYKFLLPDSNAAVIGLLFYIANNSLPHDASTFPLAFDPESMINPFSQTFSSYTMNVCWSLSLILSLTTVLIGTTALQWLREHQSYSGYSSKEALAIFHMRSEAMSAWKVPGFFALLPLILQLALVLFFVGLIEFALPLGRSFTISVSTAVGLALLFLVTTIGLPIFQKASILAGFSTGRYSKKIPTPCPYKSPQSRFIHRAIEKIIITPVLVQLLHLEDQDDILNNDRRHLFPHINTILDNTNWSAWNRAWISLRDACHQGILDTDQDLYIHRRDWKDTFPLSDITRYLIKAAKEAPSSKHTESFLTAVYYCFKEVSGSLWSIPSGGGDFPLDSIDRRNHYFEQLQEFERRIGSTFNFLTHGGIYKFGRFSQGDLRLAQFVKRHSILFRHDQLFMFLNILLKRQTSKALVKYQRELGLRILGYLIKGHLRLLTPMARNFYPTTVFQTFRPPCTQMNGVYENLVGETFNHNLNSDTEVNNGYGSPNLSEDLDIVHKIFTSVAVANVPQDEFSQSLYTNGQLHHLVDQLALRIAGTRYIAHTYTSEQLMTSLSLVAHHLNRETSSSSSNQLGQNRTTLLYYLSSIFLHGICRESPNFIPHFQRQMDSDFGQCLNLLLAGLQTYKERTPSGEPNRLMEQRFHGLDTYKTGDTVQRFSDEWWNFLFKFLPSTPGGPAGHYNAGVVLPGSAGLFPPLLPSSSALPQSPTRAKQGGLHTIRSRSLQSSGDSITLADFGDARMEVIGVHGDMSSATLVGTERVVSRSQ